MKQKKNLLIYQNYLVFIPTKKFIKYFTGTFGLNRGSLMEYQKKILKI